MIDTPLIYRIKIRPIFHRVNIFTSDVLETRLITRSTCSHPYKRHIHDIQTVLIGPAADSEEDEKEERVEISNYGH